MALLHRFLGSTWLLHIVLLAGAVAAFWVVEPSPTLLAPLVSEYASRAPYVVGTAVALLAVVYNRANTALLAVVLVAAHDGLARLPGAGLLDAGTALHWAALLVPFNLVLLMLLEDRGLFSRPGFYRVAVLAAQAAAVAGALVWFPGLLTTAAGITFLPAEAADWTGLSDQAVLALALGFLALGGLAITERTPPVIGAWAALAAFGFGAHLESVSAVIHGAATFTTVALVALLGAVLQEAHHLAFRDALTGLPNRRAMDALMRQLTGRYAIAMLDVDHFKGFNDTYGHEIGDQVLRRVAAILGKVKGGGRPFRYGGEEFAVIFPSRYAEDVLDYLEELREEIATTPFLVRSGQRSKKDQEAKKARGRNGGKAVQITISIGVAEPGRRAGTPDEVIQLADAALYRAKEAGRNRVVH